MTNTSRTALVFRATDSERKAMERIKVRDGVPFQVQLQQALQMYLAAKQGGLNAKTSR
jgi:hypothetical protein